MITFESILFALTHQHISVPSAMITEAVIDSRKVIPGALFIALPGEHADGHQYVGDAFLRGALFAIIQQDLSSQFQTINLRKPDISSQLSQIQLPVCLLIEDSLSALQILARYWRQQLALRVIGITGSVGKSTTKELVAEVLSQKYHTFKNPGNYNNEIGLPLTILNMGYGYERAVLEMGFYIPGEIAFLCEIAKPETGIITNIGTVHAERAGSQEEIIKGKAELLQALPPAPQGIAILNYDDSLVRSMSSQTNARIITYGLDKHADLSAENIHGLGLNGIEFQLNYQGQKTMFKLPLLGRHSVQTALRAIAVGLSDNMNYEEIQEGLMESHGQLRLVAVKTKNGALILDDTYNATPESTIAALDLLSELKGQRIAVLGDMRELGQYEQQGHEQVGMHAAATVHQLIAVGQLGKTIATAAQSSGLSPSAITWVEDAQQATELLRYHLQPGDVVLVKGSHAMRMDRISETLEESG